MAGSLIVNTLNNKDISVSPVATESQVIGVGQTWQNVTASRTFGVTYTNNTGKPIEVSIIFDSVNTSAQSRLIIDGIIIQDIFFGSGSEGSMSNIIPNNSTYSIVIVTGFTIRQWNELR